MATSMKACDSVSQVCIACPVIVDSRCSTPAVASEFKSMIVEFVQEIYPLLLGSCSSSFRVLEEPGSSATGQVLSVERAGLQLKPNPDEFRGTELLVEQSAAWFKEGTQVDGSRLRQDVNGEVLLSGHIIRWEPRTAKLGGSDWRSGSKSQFFGVEYRIGSEEEAVWSMNQPGFDGDASTNPLCEFAKGRPRDHETSRMSP